MKHYIPGRIWSKADDYGWDCQTEMLRRDGYEIYFYNESKFEFAMRDPESRELEQVFQYERHVESPFVIALLQYILQHPEEVAELRDEG